MKAVSLFDATGIMLQDWARAGYECYCYDILNDDSIEPIGSGVLRFVKADLLNPNIQGQIIDLNPAFMASFPPCTDLAISGAKHFINKLNADENVWVKALSLVEVPIKLSHYLSCPWFLENPVSLISQFWRSYDFSFHPYEFGGYLPANEIEHPRYPGYIAPRDAYPKKTCLWTGNGYILPPKKPVEPEPGWNRQTLYLGGSSLKTKIIRSATPRGFARANFELYA